MPTIKETTVHDVKTHFSQYASQLLSGVFDEIVVKNRTVPTLRIIRYEEPRKETLRYGIARERGHLVVSDDWNPNDGDEVIEELFGEYL